MKKPTVASQKKVTPENLAKLGAERLAEIVYAAALSRPELKRRLRMELAAEQGVEHLAPEIDKRLASLETSRSKVGWRQKGAFIRDIDGTRGLIVSTLAGLDRPGAVARLWRLLALFRSVARRSRDKDGQLAAVFEVVAGDLGAMLRDEDVDEAAGTLAEAIRAEPLAWAIWIEALLRDAPKDLADLTLRALSEGADLPSGALGAVRRLADASGNVEAYRATFTGSALKTPGVAADVAMRLLARGRVEEASDVLTLAAPKFRTPNARDAAVDGQGPDFEWESAWIEMLDQAGRGSEAQEARWRSFERTLSVERARAFTKRLDGFDDMEAEEKAFAFAAAHGDAAAALRFLMDWPALGQAARMIEARPDELAPDAEDAEAWAGKLVVRYPAAAGKLLRLAAAVAFKRRQLATAQRLTAEAEALAG